LQRFGRESQAGPARKTTRGFVCAAKLEKAKEFPGGQFCYSIIPCSLFLKGLYSFMFLYRRPYKAIYSILKFFT
jgi:hypothetical protein